MWLLGFRGVVHEATATAKLIRPLFWTLFVLTGAIILSILLVHPIRLTEDLPFHRAVLLPLLLGAPVAMLTFSTHWSARLRVPVIFATALAIGALSSIFGDDHRIRATWNKDAEARTKLGDAVEEWKKENCERGVAKCQTRPIIVVAAGGASRSAFHVAGVLGTLLDEQSFSPLRGHTDRVWTASFHPDGRHALTASADSTARIWNIETGKQMAELKHHTLEVNQASFNRDGSRVVTASDDHTSAVWDWRANSTVVFSGHTGSVWTASFSPDGKRVVTASSDKTARVWNAETAEQIHLLKDHEETVWSASFNHDGTRIVTTSNDKTARLWNATNGEPIGHRMVHNARVRTAMFSPDGNVLVTASDDGTAALWNAMDGTELHVLRHHAGFVLAASFNHDGTRVVTASADETAIVWDPNNGKALVVLRGHSARVKGASFNAEGARVVTASWDNTARVWDANTGDPIAELKGHYEDVNTAAFDVKGRILTASDDRTARVWEPFLDKTGTTLGTDRTVDASGGCRRGRRGDSANRCSPFRPSRAGRSARP